MSDRAASSCCGQNDDGNITVRAKVASEIKKFNTVSSSSASALLTGRRGSSALG